MKDYKELNVWRKSHRLVLAAYRVSRAFPEEEKYGLVSQLRRSATSVPANIAEGCGRGGDTEFARFLRIAMGSASELEYHFLLANDLGFIGGGEYNGLRSQIEEVKKMLTSLILKLRANG